MKKFKKLMALFLAIGMILSMCNIPIMAEEGVSTTATGSGLTIGLEIFRYPDANAPTNITELKNNKVDIDNGEKLEKGEKIVVGIKYSGLQNLTQYGYKYFSCDLDYTYDYFKPLYLDSRALTNLESDPTSTAKTLNWSEAGKNFPKQFMPQQFTDGYKFNQPTDFYTKTDETLGIIRTAYSFTSISENDIYAASDIISDNDGYFMFYEFEVKKATSTTQAKFEISTVSEGQRTAFGMGIFKSVDAAGNAEEDRDNAITTHDAFIEKGNTDLGPINVSIIAPSNQPKVTTNKVYNTDGSLDTTSSTITVDKLIDKSGQEVDIPASTDVNLYKATSTVDPETGDIVLTKDGSVFKSKTTTALGETVTFDLNETVAPAALATPAVTEMKDFIVTAIEPDSDESHEVQVLAATALPDVQDECIITKYDLTNSTFGTNSHVRVYTIGGVSVDQYSQINLYDSENGSVVDTFNTIEHDNDNNADYIKVDLAGKDSTKTYYLTAKQGNRDESASKVVIRKQSYAVEAASAKVSNNTLKDTDSEIVVTNLVKENGTATDVNAGTVIKVYTDANGANEMQGVTYSDVTGDGGKNNVKVVIPKANVTKEGGKVYLTATEADRLESTLVEITIPKAGNEILGVVDKDGNVIDPDGNPVNDVTVSEDDKARIDAEQGVIPVGSEVKIPKGTHKDDFADYGLVNGKIAVYLSEAKEVDGTNTNIMFVSIGEWDVSAAVDADDKAQITNGTDSQTYEITAEFNATDLENQNLSAPAGLKATNDLTVTAKSVITDVIEPTDPEAGEITTGANTVPNPVVVPVGTKEEELKNFGLTGNNVAVKVSPAVDNGDGTTTDIFYVTIDWNYSDLTYPLALDGANDPTDYTLTGTFNQQSLIDAGIEASDITYTPNTVVRVTGSKAGSGVVDEDGNIVPEPETEDKKPTQDVLDKIEQETDATNYKKVIYVTKDSSVADAKAKLETGKKMPVIVYEKDTATGNIKQDVVFITVDWDTTSIDNATFDTVGDTFTVTGKLNEQELTAAGVVAPPAVTDLKTVFEVVNKVELRLNKGNATAEDITAGFKESDIFVYCDYLFADPMLTIQGSKNSYTVADMPAGSLVRTVDVITATGAVGSPVTLPDYTANEALNQFALTKKVDFSKHYRITYTFTDPDSGEVATADRDVYAIFKRGDFDRDGIVGAADLSAIADHQSNVLLIDLTDDLYKSKTANTSRDANNIIGSASLSAMADHQSNVKLITDDYAIKKVNGANYMDITVGSAE